MVAVPVPFGLVTITNPALDTAVQAQVGPVVTTTVGIEGIDARFGEDVLVADSPEDFAGSVITLLQDKELQQKLAINGRRLVESKYDWQVVLGELDKVYQRLAGTRKS